jgi:hypothetical protein
LRCGFVRSNFCLAIRSFLRNSFYDPEPCSVISLAID